MQQMTVNENFVFVPHTVANYGASFHKSWFLEIDQICICFAVIWYSSGKILYGKQLA